MNYGKSGYGRSGYSRLDSDTVGFYTFDKYAKTIYVSALASIIDLPEMYSRWVDWIVVDENIKIKPAMKYSGFDLIPTGFTGATFFMTNGWKCVYNPTTTAITGVLYSKDYATGYWNYKNEPIYPVTVSAVVNTVTIGGAICAPEEPKEEAKTYYASSYIYSVSTLLSTPSTYRLNSSNLGSDSVLKADITLNDITERFASAELINTSKLTVSESYAPDWCIDILNLSVNTESINLTPNLESMKMTPNTKTVKLMPEVVSMKMTLETVKLKYKVICDE